MAGDHMLDKETCHELPASKEEEEQGAEVWRSFHCQIQAIEYSPSTDDGFTEWDRPESGGTCCGEHLFVVLLKIQIKDSLVGDQKGQYVLHLYTI